MISPTEAIIFHAFMASYAQLKDNPLPGAEQTELQSKLKDICQDLPGNIGKLNTLAKEYPALNKLYEDNYRLLHGDTRQRTKGPKPQTDYEAESQTDEIPNLAFILDGLDSDDKKLLEEEAPDLLKENPENFFNKLKKFISPFVKKRP